MREIVFKMKPVPQSCFNPNYYYNQDPFTIMPEETILILLDKENSLYQMHLCCDRLVHDWNTQLGYVVLNRARVDGIQVETNTCLTDLLEFPETLIKLVTVDNDTKADDQALLSALDNI